MLETLRIRGLGVIDDVEVEFAPGLTVLTGETGAGKTMVLNGVGLLLGGRAEADRVRPGARAALVEGRVALPDGHPVLDRAEQAGAELDDGVLLVARTVSAEGRSRAHLGGRSVPAALLAELAEELVAVHGQADQRRLLRPGRQRAALDRFAGPAVLEPLARYAEAYARLRDVRAELARIVEQARERAREADLLRHGLAEIGAVGPAPGEETDLAAEEARLAHADGLRAAAVAAATALVGDPEGATDVDAAALLGAARRALEPVAAHDPTAAALAERVAETVALVADAGVDQASDATGIDGDPVRLAAVQERRAALAGLLRRYGATTREVLDWAEQATARLAELDGDEDRVEQLRAAERDLLTGLAVSAGQVSAARRQAAERFAAAVTAELAGLAMPHARLVVDVRQSGDPAGLVVPGVDGSTGPFAFGPAGVDEVELRLAAHPGAAAVPLQRGASGGELSRVMLAVEVVFAGADPVPTFVFDEVDAGVGGKAAVEVGHRLARLAGTAQVLVVTHLPQVAAFADRHLRVSRTEEGTVTRTGVTVLGEPERVQELSRMLAGLEGSDTALAHAEELLATARDARSTAAAR